MAHAFERSVLIAEGREPFGLLLSIRAVAQMPRAVTLKDLSLLHCSVKIVAQKIKMCNSFVQRKR
jgi:hypothetical protein